jgi:hypothetical protein
MYLLFILLHILGNNSRNSRFGRFNSRLGQPKFSVKAATGSYLQLIDLSGDSFWEMVVSWQNRENSRINGKNRDCTPFPCGDESGTSSPLRQEGKER